MTVHFGPRPFNLANIEVYNASHFMKGALTATLFWWLFVKFGLLASILTFTVCFAFFLIFFRTKMLYAAFNVAFYAGLIIFFSAVGQLGPLGFAFIATLIGSLAIEFWQLSRGNLSDGFDLMDVAFDILGWVNLVWIVEVMESFYE